MSNPSNLLPPHLALEKARLEEETDKAWAEAQAAEFNKPQEESKSYWKYFLVAGSIVTSFIGGGIYAIATTDD